MAETLPFLFVLLVGPVALVSLGLRVLVWAMRGMRSEAAEPPEPDGPGGLRVLRGGAAPRGVALRRAA